MPQVRAVAVVGAGTMGQGIAQVAAAAGYEVMLFDVDRQALQRALGAVRDDLDKGIQRGKLTEAERDGALERLGTTDRLSEAASEADLVVEAVPESLALKREIFGKLDGIVQPECLLASNTSSLSITAIAAGGARPERVLGMHYFNPVPRMRLLELVRGERTADEVLDTALEFGRSLGKEPIVVRDSPGFATSRLGLVLGLEAMRMLEQSVASAEDIDKAMTLGYGHPMGPLKVSDWVGLDVRLAIAEHLYGELGSEAFRPPELLRKMVAAGKLGRKSGQGFYEW